MKALIKKTLYAGLGLLGDGTDSLRNLAEELARKADVSEAQGRKIARKLQVRSSLAVKSIRKSIDEEVTKVASALHEAIREEASKPAAVAKKTSSKKLAKAQHTRTRGKTV